MLDKDNVYQHHIYSTKVKGEKIYKPYYGTDNFLPVSMVFDLFFTSKFIISNVCFNFTIQLSSYAYNAICPYFSNSSIACGVKIALAYIHLSLSRASADALFSLGTLLNYSRIKNKIKTLFSKIKCHVKLTTNFKFGGNFYSFKPKKIYKIIHHI